MINHETCGGSNGFHGAPYSSVPMRPSLAAQGDGLDIAKAYATATGGDRPGTRAGRAEIVAPEVFGVSPWLGVGMFTEVLECF